MRERIDKQKLLFVLLLFGAAICGGSLFFRESSEVPVETIDKTAFASDGTAELAAETEDGRRIELTLSAPARSYTKEEADALLKEEAKRLEGQILGQNSSLLEVRYDLALPKSLRDGEIALSWYSDAPELLDFEGHLHAGAPKEGADVVLTALLSLEEASLEQRFSLRVYPSLEEAALKERILQAAEEENRPESAKGDAYYLPDEADGVALSWFKKRERTGGILFFLALLALALACLSKRQRREEAQKRRREELERDYPEIISKLQLYLGAGLSMRSAFSRIAGDFARQKQQGRSNAAGEEVQLCVQQMSRGVSEAEAYEAFGIRCAVPAYRGLSLLLVQNLKKGGAGLMEILEREVQEAFETRKRSARSEGEKASVKLLLPMGLMLLIVLALIMIPAMMGI